MINRITNDLEQCSDDLYTLVELLLGHGADHVERISGSGNNGVYKVLSGKDMFALKIYRLDPGDERNRLRTEIAALEFMQDNEIKNVPTPIAHDLTANCALFQWIPGTPIISPDETHFKAATHFADQLLGLSNLSQTRQWELASDACLSLSDVTQQTAARLERFQGIGNLSPECAKFIETEFQPNCDEIFDRQLEKAEQVGIDPETAIKLEAHILSPSDFGFHNAIEKSSGDIVFLDFEYFGRDSPFKLICDFILHPGMNLPESSWPSVIDGFAQIYRLNFRERHQITNALPLFALRWCMIMLNVYLRHNADIGLAEMDQANLENFRKTRLENVRIMLERAKSLARSNPF